MENKKVKITKKDYFNQLLTIEEVKSNSAMVEFINHELELLARKSASHGDKTAKRQIENDSLSEALYNEMQADIGYQITEIMNSFSSMSGLTNQKISVLLHNLIDKNLVRREEVKKKATFFKIG